MLFITRSGLSAGVTSPRRGEVGSRLRDPGEGLRRQNCAPPHPECARKSRHSDLSLQGRGEEQPSFAHDLPADRWRMGWCSAGFTHASRSASRWCGACSTSSISCTARSSCWAPMWRFFGYMLFGHSSIPVGRPLRVALLYALGYGLQAAHHQPRYSRAGADHADADVRPRSHPEQRDAGRVHGRLPQGQCSIRRSARCFSARSSCRATGSRRWRSRCC